MTKNRDCQVQNTPAGAYTHTVNRMPVHSYRDAIFKCDSLDTISKVILLCLDYHADNTTASCFPSIKRIAREVGCSVRSIKYKLPILEESGFLAITRRYKDNSKISNLYTLELPQQFELTYRKRQFEIPEEREGASQRQGGGARDARGVVQEMHEGGARDAHRTSPNNYRESDSLFSSAASGSGASPSRPVSASSERVSQKMNKGCSSSSPKVGVFPDEDFESFWALYPKKDGKAVAKKSYAAARKKGATATDILSLARGYAQELEKDGTERKYIKHPSTWLNSQSWDDRAEISRLLESCPKPPKTARQAILDGDLSQDMWDRMKQNFPHISLDDIY